jgi:serine/threonine-protein kinase
VSDDPRVQELLEQLISSDASPEEVCGACTELLPVVRERWQRVLRMRAEVEAMFPPKATTATGRLTLPLEDTSFPEIPGYEFEAVLGTGGMGVVFKARQVRLNRLVALKMTLAGAYTGMHERERFQREAEAVAALRHPNVVQIYDVGDSGGKPYFTMEYVEGGSLADKLVGTPLPVRDAAGLLAKLAAAVHAAHVSGIVHRDLKPGNILLTADGVPKISDFGLARRLDGEVGITRSGAALGTPCYMAPEQARGKAGAAGPTADIYSLGAVLYELLTGRPPFRAESAAETVHQLLTQDPVPPSRLNGKVPPDLETVCLKCLSKDSKLRYATAGELHEDLERFLHGEAILARPEGRLRRALRAARRRPAVTVGGIAGVLFAALILTGIVWVLFDRAVVGQAVAGDLEEIEKLLQRSSLPEAKSRIERAQARLGARESSALRQRLGQREREVEQVGRLERINLDMAITVNGVINFQQADRDYDEAFREFGIGQNGDDPETVAARIRESKIRTALVAALDRWSVAARTTARADWAMEVARLAEPVPTEWRRNARDKKQRRNRQALLGLLEKASINDESVPLLLALNSFLSTINEPPPDPWGLRALKKAPVPDILQQIQYLTKVQQAYPNDLWANISLGNALFMGNRPADAARYFQVVIGLRPDLVIGYFHLGRSLAAMAAGGARERFNEAVVQLQKALEIEPTSGKTHLLLVGVLEQAGKHDEAIAQARIALDLNFAVAYFRCLLGHSLNNKGQVDEGLEQFRLAIALEPSNPLVQDGYREVLTKARRWKELRPAWGKALEGDRPNHNEWYGYAEMCLYLGQEDEYRLARQTLLARFGGSKSPTVAERTARACLLLPLSADEMSKVASLAEMAARADRKKYASFYPYFQFVKAFAEYRLGHFDPAIALLRGDASAMSGPLPLLVLSMALYRTGKEGEAHKTFAEAMLNHEWRESRVDSPDGWIRHVLRREAEKLIYPNLPAVVEGKQQPRDNDERLALIGVCRFENRNAALARIYAEAFAGNPDLILDHCLEAARAAVQVGSGRGVDAGTLGEPERKRWRQQARTWLREDLTIWMGELKRDFNEAHDRVGKALTEWQNDPELAGIRDAIELEQLSAEEKQDCKDLWAKVKAVLDSTGKAK